MRHWIDLVTQPLMEASVINVPDVENFCAQFANKVGSPEAKTWFSKKLRKEILNDEKGTFLKRAELSHLPAEQPDWLKAAIERGDELMMFLPRDVMDGLNHIVDFMQSLEKTAAYTGDVAIHHDDSVVAKRLLTKLMKLDLEQMEAAADDWFKRMGNRALTGTKAGVNIVHTWPDGFYAVSYTELETMKRDGAELQNCLSDGMYWSSVESGEQSVYGIRSPSHEAVVGIRVENKETPRLHECKGKNNKPPIKEYLPYCKDFLTKLGTRNNIPELRSQGIMCGKGGYGTFEEVAIKEKIGRFDAMIVDNVIELSFKGEKVETKGRDGTLLLPLSQMREFSKKDVAGLINELEQRNFKCAFCTQNSNVSLHQGLYSMGLYTWNDARYYDDRSVVVGSLDEVAKKKKTPFGEVWLTTGYAICPIANKKVTFKLVPTHGFYFSSGNEFIDPKHLTAQLPESVFSIVNEKQLAELLNRLRHIRIKNQIDLPENAGLTFEKVGSKKLYAPFTDKLTAMVRDKAKGAILYRFPKKGPAEKLVVANAQGYRQIKLGNGTLSMRALAGNSLRGDGMMVSIDALGMAMKKLKVVPVDEDGYLAKEGVAYDTSKKALVEIDDLPAVGEVTERFNIRKSPTPNQYFFKERDHKFYSVLTLNKNNQYQFTGNGWTGGVDIFQYINDAEPLAKGSFYNFGRMTEYTGMMSTDDGFASSPSDIADQLKKLAAFTDSDYATHATRAEALAKKAFLTREITDAEQMELVEALTKNIIGPSNHRGGVGYSISPYAVAFANSNQLTGKPMEILRKRIDMAVEKAEEMKITNPFHDDLKPSW